MNDFELFMGCFGNGYLVCNKAVEEHGDYKKIAHISNAGNIKWYVPAETVPGEVLRKIEHKAHVGYECFKKWMELEYKNRPENLYGLMLDKLRVGEFVDHCWETRDMKLDDKIHALWDLYVLRS